MAALIALEGDVFAASWLLVMCSIMLDRLRPGEGLVLGVAGGSLFGVSDVSLKLQTHAANADLIAL